LKSSKKSPPIHQTEARLIRRYSAHLVRIELMLPKLIELRFMNRIFYALSGPRRVLSGWVRVPGRGPNLAYALLRGIN